jgi:hypothetical protein
MGPLSPDDPEVRRAIERFEAAGADAADEERLAIKLRQAAEEHAELLRRSREVGDLRVYR